MRTALALSALTGKPLELKNIRASRPNPGLQAQHLTSLLLLKKICNAKLKGAFIGSKSVSFEPKAISGGTYTVNIGTAGSITLLFQSILLPALFCRERVSVKAFGGTDVPFSPPANHFSKAFLSLAEKMGAKTEFKVSRRGYYSKGNGLAYLSTSPCKQLRGISLKKIFLADHVSVFSHSAGLPREVSLNQSKSAKRILAESEKGFEIIEETESNEVAKESIGSGIEIIGFSDSGIIGVNALGEREKDATIVGQEASHKFILELANESAIDSHLADQLIPLMALSRGKSEILCSPLSGHAKNNILVCEKMLGVKFEQKAAGKCILLSVKGIWFNQ
ncbi:MAG: RNA 3'-terminal phosphate cyclase, partial [archaeon]